MYVCIYIYIYTYKVIDLELAMKIHEVSCPFSDRLGGINCHPSCATFYNAQRGTAQTFSTLELLNRPSGVINGWKVPSDLGFSWEYH